MKVGDKIRIIRMDGEPRYDGKVGYVDHIDDAGQVHGTWGGCALIPGVDEYEVVEEAADLKASFGVKEAAFVLGIYALIYGLIGIIEELFGVVIN